MGYTQTNKEAWNEAFEHRRTGWGDDNAKRLQTETLPFWDENVAEQLRAMSWRGKHVAQFCCNNGRELLSLLQLGAASGVGIDIADNFIAQAEKTAREANISNCTFLTCDLLELDSRYDNAFDVIYFTIGAVTWFENLNELFAIVSRCLKPGGTVFIHDYHPVFNMLPLPGEGNYANGEPVAVNSYFRSEPWQETMGMGYITPPYESKLFTSFAHTFSQIVNGLAKGGIYLTALQEYDYDIGLTEVYDDRGLPLSYLLTAKKM